jgi:hypothetical protein
VLAEAGWGNADMLKVFAVILLALASGAAGYAIGRSAPQSAPREHKYVTPYDENKDCKPLANGTSLGCKALADTYLSAHAVPDPLVTAKADAGTDTVAMTLADDGQTISFLTGAAVREGATEGRPIHIVGKTPNYIVAANYAWPSFEVIILEIQFWQRRLVIDRLLCRDDCRNDVPSMRLSGPG